MKPAEELSDTELIGELVGPRKSQGVGEVFDLALRDLVSHDIGQLRASFGLPPQGARRLAAAAELHRRLARSVPVNRPRLNTPEAVHALMGPRLAAEEVETFWALPLDARSRLIGEPRVVSRGDIDGTDAGPRAFFRAVIRTGATSCVAVHPHPSGEPEPSLADYSVTQRLVQAGRALDVALVDHVVITGGAFSSIRRLRPQLWAPNP
jgi:DNA repair protein RadC